MFLIDFEDVSQEEASNFAAELWIGLTWSLTLSHPDPVPRNSIRYLADSAVLGAESKNSGLDSLFGVWVRCPEVLEKSTSESLNGEE